VRWVKIGEPARVQPLQLPLTQRFPWHSQKRADERWTEWAGLSQET
jgi:hypothetical protein